MAAIVDPLFYSTEIEAMAHEVWLSTTVIDRRWLWGHMRDAKLAKLAAADLVSERWPALKSATTMVADDLLALATAAKPEDEGEANG